MITMTKSAAETQKFGEKFAQKIAGGGVVCLFGDLGSGKTTLVQGIARGLGLTKRLISPTFIIVRRYELPNKPGSGFLWHIDLYRLQEAKEIRNLGIDELWEDPANILLIEWPEKIVDILPKKRWEVKLETLDENTRKISLNFEN